MQVVHYLTANRHDLYQEWVDGLRDARVYAALVRRIDRLRQRNFGDHKFCRDGVWELRTALGAGYRVYYAQSGKTLILLLCGGDKRTQQKDIDVRWSTGRTTRREPNDQTKSRTPYRS